MRCDFFCSYACQFVWLGSMDCASMNGFFWDINNTDEGLTAAKQLTVTSPSSYDFTQSIYLNYGDQTTSIVVFTREHASTELKIREVPPATAVDMVKSSHDFECKFCRLHTFRSCLLYPCLTLLPTSNLGLEINSSHVQHVSRIQN